MKEKIVVTDGHTLNPGDLSWAGLQELGEVILYERTSLDEVYERCKDASVIVTNKTKIPAMVISNAPKLKVIAVTATGFNIVDVDAAKEAKVAVCNVPGYGTDSVAQHTFALLLELTNHVGQNGLSVASGDWSKHRDFCYSLAPLVELSGKTIGIVGYGKIGRKVADIAQAFGMNVLFNSTSKQTDSRFVGLEQLFRNSDVVSLHCPLTSTNAGFVNFDLLSKMKPAALLINTARGQLVNEAELAQALKQRILSGAGLDVLSVEPPPPDHPLIGLPNCIVTPHNAWCSFEARSRMMETTVKNVRAALNGNPQNLVN